MKSKSLSTLICLMVLFTSSFGQMVKDFGMTSPQHSKYVKEIVFSSKPIVFQKEVESQFSNDFTLDKDNIYIICYFERSFQNQVVKEGGKVMANGLQRVNMTYYVNGEKVGKLSYSPEQGMFKTWTGLSFPDSPINGRIKDIKKRSLAKTFNTTVTPNLKVGKNKVRLECSFIASAKKNGKFIEFTPSEPMAVGEFTINVPLQAAIDNHFKKNGPFMPKPGMTNADLNKELFAAAKSAEDGYSVNKVVVVSRNWEYKKVGSAIVSRKLVAAVAKEYPDGNCKVYYHFFEQDYDGNNYDKAKMLGVEGDNVYYISKANL